MLLPFTATTLDSSTDTLSATKVRATSLRLLSTPNYSCFVCCSQMRRACPNFTELFTILVVRTVISCSSSCTVSAHFPKGCFFQFTFQLSCFIFYFCRHAPNSQVQYGCIVQHYHPKGNPKQTLYFDLGLHMDYLSSPSYPHATAENLQ